MPDTDASTTPKESADDSQGVRPRVVSASGGGGGAGRYPPTAIRQIDWESALPFLSLFRGFGVAIHPSKLILALAAILLLYTGGRLLDGIWPARHQAVTGEPFLFESYVASEENVGLRAFSRERDRRRQFDRMAAEDLRVTAAARRGVSPEEVSRGELRQEIRDRRDARLESFRGSHPAAVAGEDEVTRRAADLRRVEEERGVYRQAAAEWAAVAAADGRGLFVEFYDYQASQLDGLLRATLRFDVLEPGGVLSRLWRFLYVGPLWALSQHPVYFSLLFAWGLVLLTLFGGAVTRIAAVQVARDEKIGLRSALRFSSGKFVSFLSAPLMPLLIMGVIGLAVALAGLVGNIPWAGEIVVAFGLVAALVAGLTITLVLVGLAGGFSLMYPTIAAEGTDSFDALSRGFSYLYARPWKLGFYAAVGLVYGAATYLFVRLFVWLVLVVTHTAVGLLIFRSAAGLPLLEAMWPRPGSFGDLSYGIEFINLSATQSAGAVIISFWVYLLIGLLAAYALSLYLSLSTIAYFLIRRDVDATDTDEVYVDPQDEEFAGYSEVPEADEPGTSEASSESPDGVHGSARAPGGALPTGTV